MVGAPQCASWLELAGELLQHPDGVLGPGQAALAALLVESFEAGGCSRNRISRDWADHVEEYWPVEYASSAPINRVAIDATWHPLLRWYAVTGSTAPQILSRVPEAVADRTMTSRWRDFAGQWGLAVQLVIPLQADQDGAVFQTVVRRDGDFGDDAAVLARLVQPVLVALHRQRQALAAAPAAALASATGAGLTGRELAVLTLLGQGLTAAGIGRRLGASPRTVDKHLQHIYRKLGVRDRLTAVLCARDAGLLRREVPAAGARPLPPPPAPAPPADPAG